jgi:hypothetical protein
MKKLERFNKKELRWDFYPMFLNLMKKGLETETYLFMLSTWNFACFRYALRGFNLDRFKLALKKLELNFKKFKKLDFQTIDFDKYQKDIKKIFLTLSEIKGVQKTGAPKLMHLKVPQVFVMWDAYIRNYYGFKKGDADDYFGFLKLMQKKFHNVKARSGRTSAKLIDEHNFKTISVPALRKIKLSKNKK